MSGRKKLVLGAALVTNSGSRKGSQSNSELHSRISGLLSAEFARRKAYISEAGFLPLPLAGLIANYVSSDGLPQNATYGLPDCQLENLSLPGCQLSEEETFE